LKGKSIYEAVTSNAAAYSKSFARFDTDFNLR
jgi:hypothetical protein